MTDNRRFNECVAVVFQYEGGFVDHPRDPGGATNRGITLRTLRDWRGDDSLTADAVRALTEEADELTRHPVPALQRMMEAMAADRAFNRAVCL
jgi:lysozyme family protein